MIVNTHTCNKLRQLHDPVVEQQLPQAAAKTLTRTRSVCRDGGQVKKFSGQNRAIKSRWKRTEWDPDASLIFPDMDLYFLAPSATGAA